jgi:diguanylate cyclase (GGDEF)-like protein
MNERIANDILAAGRTRIAYAPIESAASCAIDQQPYTHGTQQQFKLLASSNACLRRNLIRFSRRLKQAGHLAYHDELTGLPSRDLLLDRLQQAMQQAARQHKPVLLLYIDLDRFQSINDALGYVAGDRLLQQVAARLAACIRGADTACRFGGDEFVILLPEIDGYQGAAAALHKIRAQLATPYAIDGQSIMLTASVGTAVYRGDQQSRENLIRQARMDMHRAKATSKPPSISYL